MVAELSSRMVAIGTDRQGVENSELMLPEFLVCPRCKVRLQVEKLNLICTSCQAIYTVKEGIPCFAPSDPFYDTYAAHHCPYATSPRHLKRLALSTLPYWSWREWRFWNRTIPRCDRLLDLGCGRGRELFVERAGETVGFDASFQFIRDCAAHYRFATQGSLPNLPFDPKTFDVVTSSHVLGHIRRDQKDDLIAEIARVLRPGGLTAHIIETDSEHTLVTAAKRDRDTYESQFIGQDGHVGLEPATRVVQRFEAHGFRLQAIRLVDAIIPSLQNFRKYLNHPRFHRMPGVTWLQRLNRWVDVHPVTNVVYEIAMGTFHHTLEQWFGNPANAQFIMVAFRLNGPRERSDRMLISRTVK